LEVAPTVAALTGSCGLHDSAAAARAVQVDVHLGLRDWRSGCGTCPLSGGDNGGRPPRTGDAGGDNFGRHVAQATALNPQVQAYALEVNAHRSNCETRNLSSLSL
jgi:hypothetical protein